jgi:glutathione S-transferase
LSGIKLTYFDFDGGRGEDCRLALHIAGVEFEDNRIKGGQWPERKAFTPFGNLPVLENEEGDLLGQSNAVLTWIGRSYALHPGDPWQAARHEALMSFVEELRGRVEATFSIQGDDEKKAAREKLSSGYIQSWGAHVEDQIGPGPFVAGGALNVVDLKLFVVMGWFANGILDHIPTGVLKDFPKIRRLHEAVAAHEGVKSWYAGRS